MDALLIRRAINGQIAIDAQAYRLVAHLDRGLAVVVGGTGFFRHALLLFAHRADAAVAILNACHANVLGHVANALDAIAIAATSARDNGATPVLGMRAGPSRSCAGVIRTTACIVAVFGCAFASSATASVADGAAISIIASRRRIDVLAAQALVATVRRTSVCIVAVLGRAFANPVGAGVAGSTDVAVVASGTAGRRMHAALVCRTTICGARVIVFTVGLSASAQPSLAGIAAGA